MDIQLAKEKGRKLGISEVMIVREEYEMLLLSGIFESPIGKNIVFRGGTALRLAYGSQRFSEDLDFSEVKGVNVNNFRKWCKEVTDENPNISLKEALKKKFTLFALFKVKDPSLPETVSIKIEISVRRENWVSGKDYRLVSLQSAVAPITVLAYVATPERIEKEKLRISPKRIRDVYDLWFLAQILKKKYEMDFTGFKPGEVKREMYKLLPLGARVLIEPWLQKK